jgi:aspartyl aminopeptidase
VIAPLLEAFPNVLYSEVHNRSQRPLLNRGDVKKFSLPFDANFACSQKEVTACQERGVWRGLDQGGTIIGPKTAARSRVSNGTVFVQKPTISLHQFVSVFTHMSAILNMHQLTVPENCCGNRYL